MQKAREPYKIEDLIHRSLNDCKADGDRRYDYYRRVVGVINYGLPNVYFDILYRDIHSRAHCTASTLVIGVFAR